MADRCLNLADLLEVLAETVPDRTAVVAGDRRATFAGLDERATRVGHHLADLGVRPGEHVAVLSQNRMEWVELFFGAFKARAVPVNVNHRYVARELRNVLADSDSVALFGERSLLTAVEPVRAGLASLRHTVVIEDGSTAPLPDTLPYEDGLAAASADRAGLPVRSPDDRYLLYTGGTTGDPKGVVWRNEDVFIGAMGGGNPEGEPISSPEDLRAVADAGPLTYLVLAPLMHGSGQWGTVTALTSGATVVLLTDRTFDPRRVLDTAERERANIVMCVGDAMARPLAETLLAEPDRRLDALVAVGSGGAPLTPAVRDLWRRWRPDLLLRDSYGASETGACGRSRERPGEAPAFGTLGSASGGTVFTVLDDDLRPVQPGSGRVGRVARSGHIPLGYYKDVARTAETFRTGPDGRRWVLPGDHGTVAADGSVVLLGRGSQVINTGGEKVYPGEVEAALATHPAVRDAVVVGAPHERYGTCVAAVVALAADATVTDEELRAHCRTTLAGYKVPRRVRRVAELRRTAVGKQDYRWARSMFDG